MQRQKMDKPKKKAVDIAKEEEAHPFVTAPIKLPRLKRSVMKLGDGHLPHIVFDYRSGRWILKVDQQTII
jgi:hypothetical protein